MWLSLLLVVLVFAITIRQATQGLFSALIMAVLTICCAVVALGTHEWVAIHWLAPYWKPDYALPVALGATFGVPLVILRVAFDQLIRRACLLPALADRIGGGVCGFVTGMTMVGILAICLQMIPFDRGSILGYARISVADLRESGNSGSTSPQGGEKEKNLFLKPDLFATTLVSMLSQGIFSAEHSFVADHPNLVQAIAWVGATHPEISRYAPPKSISIVRAEPVQFVYKMTPGNSRTNEPPIYEEDYPNAGREFYMVRVKLGNPARDERKSHLFTLRQFRLVGQPAGSEPDDPYFQYYPIAIQQEEVTDLTNRHIRYKKRGREVRPVIDEIYTTRDNSNEVEIVFELPTEFEPAFLEYKREARVALSFDDTGTADTPVGKARTALPSTERAASAQETTSASSDASTSRQSPASGGSRRSRSSPPRSAEGGPPTRRRGGNVRGVTTNRGQSRFSDELPITLRAYQRVQNVELSRDALVSGHLIAEVDRQKGGTDSAVSKFYVPSDKRLLQLSSQRLQARSSLGRALSFTATTVQNYFVQDTNGNRYQLAGKYAIANVRRKKVFEVQYYSGPVGSIGGVGKFNRINERNLTANDEFLLLFLVEPGSHIISFSTGGSATRQDDLTTENLVAPP